MLAKQKRTTALSSTNRKKVKDELSPELRHLVNKRLSLNILIQGAASHAHLSSHHSVKEKLDAIDPELVDLYDKAIAGATLAYWDGLIRIVYGRGIKFWSKLNRPKNPFFHHRFLRRHGKALAMTAYESAVSRCQEKDLPTSCVGLEGALAKVALEVMSREAGYERILESIAIEACGKIIDTPRRLLNAEITREPAWGTVREPKTVRGRLLLKAMVGWGGVDRINGELQVMAKAIFWPLLVHELVKGSMELICLHGISAVSDEDYSVVMDHTEHVEYEVPMIQIGPVIYQAFLKVLPRPETLAQCTMVLSQMEPIEFEEFLFEMIEAPDSAKAILQDLISDEDSEKNFEE